MNKVKLPAFLLKKGVKIPLVVLLSIVVFLLLLNLIAPPVVRWYVEKNSKELCHRKVKLDKLRLNVFTGMVGIENFKAWEENDRDEFLSFDKLEVRINVWRLLAKEVRLTKIELVEPHVAVVQNGSQFNFDDIIEFYADDEEDTTKSDWAVDLRNIELVRGTIAYRDQQHQSAFNLNDLSLQVPRLYFSGHSSDIGLAFKLADGGAAIFKMLYDLEKNNYALHVNLKDFTLHSFVPYLKDFFNVGDLAGRLSTELQLVGNLDHILDIDVTGEIGLKAVNLRMKDGTELLRFDDFSVNIDKIDLQKNVFHFGKIALTSPQMDFHLYAQENTLTRFLQPASPQTPAETDTATETAAENSTSASPIDLKIKELVVNKCQVTYADHTLKRPFSLAVKDFNLNAENVSLKDEFEASVQAIIGNGGELNGKWKGTLQGFENHAFVLKINNFKMQDLSPYCIHYTAYPLKTGILNFRSRSIIKHNELKSKNVLDLYNCKADSKLKDVEPEYKLPMKAALYILTDRKGKISIELPLSGDVTSPEFSLKKIIWKTIGNLFVKVVAAPADFIASAFKGKNDVFADMTMNLADRNISSDLYDRLNAMSEVLKEKSEMVLEVEQAFTRADCEEMVAAHLQTADSVAIADAVARSTVHRVQMLTDYFQVQGIAADRVKVLPPVETKTPKGKVVFSFKLTMPGEMDLNGLE